MPLAEQTKPPLGTCSQSSPLQPVVVPVENENGPANYGLNPDAEVTVLIAKGGKVISSTGYAAGKFDAAAVAAGRAAPRPLRGDVRVRGRRRVSDA